MIKPRDEGETEEYSVEKIVARRVRKGKVCFVSHLATIV